MHTNRVSHQRNVIRLHSYIEYFSRNFLLFPPPRPRFVLPPTIPMMMKIFREARPHARTSRTSEMRDVNKRARFAKSASWQKTKVYVTGWRPAISSLLNRILKTERPYSACRPVLSRLSISARQWGKVGQFGAEKNLGPHQRSFIRLIIIRSLFVFSHESKKRFVSRAVYLLCSNDF